jgi:hypothetical protein
MQFLVYLTVLMVSISAVLLEVHWLTSPSPQPKPIVRTTNAPVPAPKVEGPNVALSPVYPKPSDTQRPDAGNAPQAQASVTQSAPTETAGQVAPATTAPAREAPSTSQPAPAPKLPAANAGTPSPQTAAAPPASPAETTGVAAREDNPRQAAADAMSTANHSSKPNEIAAGMPASGNRCDVQACASTYRSSRASDCTYQPFEGARRFCGKPPVQAAREQREQPERRRWSMDVELRYLDRPAARRQIDDDDGADDVDDADRGAPIWFFFGRHPRW